MKFNSPFFKSPFFRGAFFAFIAILTLFAALISIIHALLSWPA